LDLKYWNLTVSTLSDLSDALPLMAILLSKSAQSKILGAYFLFSFCIKLTTIVLIFFFQASNTHVFYHLLAPVEFTCIFLYYTKLLNWSSQKQCIVITIVLLLNILNSMLLQSTRTFNSHPWSIHTFLLLLLSFRYLYLLYLSAQDIRLEIHPGFIINAGFLLYFSGSLFTYLLGFSILSQDPIGFFANGWIIQAVANILKNVLVSYGIGRSNGHQ